MTSFSYHVAPADNFETRFGDYKGVQGLSEDEVYVAFSIGNTEICLHRLKLEQIKRLKAELDSIFLQAIAKLTGEEKIS